MQKWYTTSIFHWNRFFQKIFFFFCIFSSLMGLQMKNLLIALNSHLFFARFAQFLLSTVAKKENSNAQCKPDIFVTISCCSASISRENKILMNEKWIAKDSASLVEETQTNWNRICEKFGVCDTWSVELRLNLLFHFITFCHLSFYFPLFFSLSLSVFALPLSFYYYEFSGYCRRCWSLQCLSITFLRYYFDSKSMQMNDTNNQRDF